MKHRRGIYDVTHEIHVLCDGARERWSWVKNKKTLYHAETEMVNAYFDMLDTIVEEGWCARDSDNSYIVHMAQEWLVENFHDHVTRQQTCGYLSFFDFNTWN